MEQLGRVGDVPTVGGGLSEQRGGGGEVKLLQPIQSLSP